MTTIQYSAEIAKEITRTLSLISEDESEKLIDSILRSNRIFVAGAGRSGFMAKSFAMRLMHMGFDTYVVGETVTPSLAKNDILIIASGSGETKSLVSMTEEAKNIGVTVAAVTISPNSTIGKLSDLIIKILAKPKSGPDNFYNTIQPLGSLFEQTLLLYFDSVILRLMDKRQLESEVMFGKHANIE